MYVLICALFRKIASLDIEVFASGFTKDMEQDLQKEVSTNTVIHFIFMQKNFMIKILVLQ